MICLNAQAAEPTLVLVEMGPRPKAVSSLENMSYQPPVGIAFFVVMDFLYITKSSTLLIPISNISLDENWMEMIDKHRKHR